MGPLTVTPIYAGLLALIFLGLSTYVIKQRYKFRIALGDGGNRDMLRAIRAQANFVEYVPIALILLVILELNGEAARNLHALGGALVAARISHGLGLNAKQPQLRQVGVGVSFLVILAGAVLAILGAI